MLAKKALDARKGEIVREKYKLSSQKRSILFNEFSKLYLEHVRSYKKSASRDELSIRNLLKKFSGRTLASIHAFLIESYKMERKAEVKPASVNRELACLKHMFNLAIKWGYADTNPVREVKLFKENNQRLRYLSAQEAHNLVEACAPHLKPIVVLALNTGMRRGEIFNLKWKDVDLKNRMIRVVESKNGESRIIPMNQAVYEELKERKKDSKADLIFTNWNGKRYTTIKTGFNGAVKRAGIVDFHFHDLRHTFASNLVMAGEDLVTVKELLGHKSIQMTMRYSHLSQKHKMKAVESLNEMYKVEDGHYLDTGTENGEE